MRIAGITGQRVVHIMSMLQCVCRWKSAARGPRRECPLVVNLTMCVLMELRCARTAARVRAAISEMLDLRAIECEL